MPRLPEPYVGPRPFEAADRNLFFGRDDEAQNLVSLAIAYREVLLYSESGAGKTSLLHAKLIPLLEEEGFEVLPVVRVRGFIPEEMAPEAVSNLFIFNVLSSWTGQKDRSESLGKLTLEDYFENRRSKKNKEGLPMPRIVLVDQFEELLTLYPERREDRREFFVQVANALAKSPLLRIVFAMREDFLAQLDPYVTLLPEKLRARFRLERLRKEAALEAVRGPLAGTGRSFATGAVEKIVEDLLKVRVETGTGETQEIMGEYVEPVQLQVVCQSLWRQLPPEVNDIDEGHLQAFGDTNRALINFYEEAIQAAAQAAAVDPLDLRRWFETLFITSTGTRGMVHRGFKKTREMPNRVLDILEDRHLIRKEWRAGAHWYELTHDRFVEPIQTANLQAFEAREAKARQARDLLQSTATLLLEAEKFSSSGSREKALQYATEALALSQDSRDFYASVHSLLYLGNIYERMARLDESFASYSEALRISQQTGDQQLVAASLFSLGHILLSQERYEEAIDRFTKYIEILPKDPQGYGSRAEAFWNSGKYRKAYEDFSQELRRSRRSFHAYSGRGQTLAEMGRHREAVKDLKRALKLKSAGAEAADVRSALGLAYAGLRRFPEALQSFEAAIETNPDNASIYYNRSLAYERMKRFEDAVEDLKRALEKANPRLNSLKRSRAEQRLRDLSPES